jgi:hypothetical protein
LGDSDRGRTLVCPRAAHALRCCTIGMQRRMQRGMHSNASPHIRMEFASNHGTAVGRPRALLGLDPPLLRCVCGSDHVACTLAHRLSIIVAVYGSHALTGCLACMYTDTLALALTGGFTPPHAHTKSQGLGQGGLMCWPPCATHGPSVQPSERWLGAWGFGASEQGGGGQCVEVCSHSGSTPGALSCAQRTSYALMGLNSKRSVGGVGPGAPGCGRPSGNEVPKSTRSYTAHVATHESPLQSGAGTATWLPAHVLGLAIWRSCVHSTTVLRNRAWMPKLDFGVRGRFLREPRHTAVLLNDTSISV